MIKTKIDVISGFLGAGKTTFIKKLMHDFYHKESVVILENEFGRVNIDEDTLKREGLRVKPVQAGCICCSSSLELEKAIHEIIQEYHPERIILEPTGIAKLSQVKQLFMEEELIDLCEIDHIITIVDAGNYYQRTMISKTFFEDQIRASNLILLSKTQNLLQEDISKVVGEIHRLHPGCFLVSEEWKDITPEYLKRIMDDKQETMKNQNKLSMRINYPNDFERFEIISEKPTDMDRIKQLVQDVEHGIYGEVHRMKGICLDINQTRYSLDYIPGETILRPITTVSSNQIQSVICVIGRNLDQKKLEHIIL